MRSDTRPGGYAFPPGGTPRHRRPRRRFLVVSIVVTVVGIVVSATAASWFVFVEQGLQRTAAQSDAASPLASRARGAGVPRDVTRPTGSLAPITAPPQAPIPTRSPKTASPTATPTHTAAPRTASPKPEPRRTKTAPNAPQPTQQESYEAEVVRLTNVERANRGCAALRVDSRIVQAARAHSDDMAARDYFDHNSPDGGTPWDRMRAAGYDAPAAENIARGYPTPESVVDGWMHSSGHRANILNCDNKAIGVGVHLGSGGPWWTQDFGYN
ncbi:MAG TPA: CAP domain-containing protein [Actinopolymorphaceae bacterium]|nr:CAP domain-containing protein [Actinopolymorphaceae bacterium]